MGTAQLAMKAYDPAWYARYGMSYADGAAWLREAGVTELFTVNRFLPAPHSPTALPWTAAQAERLGGFDDERWRAALAGAGIGYWPTVSMFYDTAVLAERPAAEPIDRHGRPMPAQDWYRGCCPTDDELVEAKIRSIIACVRALAPDGVFLTFIRFPGFWEEVLPEHTRDQIPLACFCPRCLDLFAADAGLRLPDAPPAGLAAWILAGHRAEWTDWKCRIIAGVVARVRAAVRAEQPDIRIALNTIPFGRLDHENAAMEVYGQGIEHLAPHVDLFEVMTYHQILKQPPEWISAIAGEVKARSGREVVCTLQAQALYTTGYHAAAGRRDVLGPAEFAACLDQVAGSAADGAVVFGWTDFLNQLAAGQAEYVGALRRFRPGR